MNSINSVPNMVNETIKPTQAIINNNRMLHKTLETNNVNTLLANALSGTVISPIKLNAINSKRKVI